jgi:PilZ domain
MTSAQATLASHICATDRRRAERNEVTIRTIAGLPGRERVQIEIVNIAEGGALIRSARVIDERTPIMIDLPGLGWVGAQVVWYFKGQHGCSFERPIARRFVESLTAFHAPDWSAGAQ